MVEENKDDMYNEILKSADSEIDDLKERLDEKEDDYNSFPAPPNNKDSFFLLTRDMLNSNDSLKIGNLSSTELGRLDISVRKGERMSLLCRTLGYNYLAEFFRNESEITAKTSMSNKGFFTKLMVTKIRASENSNSTPSENKSKWFDFSKKGDNNEQ